jgi:hypothetical protein
MSAGQAPGKRALTGWSQQFLSGKPWLSRLGRLQTYWLLAVSPTLAGALPV